MMQVARWTDWAGAGLEHCTCRRGAEGLTLEGVVAGTRNGLYGGHYRVQTDALLRTRDVCVTYAGGARLHVTADGEGRWHDRLGDAPLPDLAGCLDVDIGITPATNTLPILRLGLAAGEAREISAAYVPLPDQIDGSFLPRPAPQRYTCLIPARRYRYEGLFRGFVAELEVDAAGLVLDYPGTFRRLPLDG